MVDGGQRLRDVERLQVGHLDLRHHRDRGGQRCEQRGDQQRVEARSSRSGFDDQEGEVRKLGRSSEVTPLARVQVGPDRQSELYVGARTR